MLPVVWNVKGTAAVVVGGGRVGRRKVETLLAAGAAVTVVDPATPIFPATVNVVPSPYRSDHLVGYNLAVAAGPPAVNVEVVRDARAAGLMVCSVSDPAAGTFTFPAAARVGPIAVAVHAGGAGPAFSRELLGRMLAGLPDGIAAHAELLREVRVLVRRTIPDPARRAALLTAAADLQHVGFDGTATEFLSELLTSAGRGEP